MHLRSKLDKHKPARQKSEKKKQYILCSYKNEKYVYLQRLFSSLKVLTNWRIHFIHQALLISNKRLLRCSDTGARIEE